jgi:hypothetical protein
MAQTSWALETPTAAITLLLIGRDYPRPRVWDRAFWGFKSSKSGGVRAGERRSSRNVWVEGARDPDGETILAGELRRGMRAAPDPRYPARTGRINITADTAGRSLTSLRSACQDCFAGWAKTELPETARLRAVNRGSNSCWGATYSCAESLSPLFHRKPFQAAKCAGFVRL